MQCAHEIHGTPTMLHPQSQAEKIRDRQKRNQGSLRGIPDDDDARERSDQSSAVSCCLRQRIPASMKPSMSPSNTESGLPTSKLVLRSLTIW